MARKSTPKTEPEISKSISPQIAITLLKRQIEKVGDLLSKRPLNDSDHTAWKNTTRDYLIKSFGSLSPNIDAVIHVSSDHGLHMGMNKSEIERYQASRLENQIKMLNSCIEQLETDIDLLKNRANIEEVLSPEEDILDKVFIVHGHNHGLKETVARFIEKFGLKTIILHEMPNKGRTIIEKFSDNSDVRFAIILLTYDDIGKNRESQE
jgi:hypothetical protein